MPDISATLENQLLDEKRLSRLELVASQWKQQLVDTTSGPLMRYRDLKTGTLDLTPAGVRHQLPGFEYPNEPTVGATNEPAVGATGVGDDDPTPKANRKAVDALLKGRTVSLSHLFSFEEGLGDARRRMKVISRDARVRLEEKGIDTLFLAAGLTTWKVQSGARPNALR